MRKGVEGMSIEGRRPSCERDRSISGERDGEGTNKGKVPSRERNNDDETWEDEYQGRGFVG
jgi:hypothetical protein